MDSRALPLRSSENRLDSIRPELGPCWVQRVQVDLSMNSADLHTHVILYPQGTPVDNNSLLYLFPAL